MKFSRGGGGGGRHAAGDPRRSGRHSHRRDDHDELAAGSAADRDPAADGADGPDGDATTRAHDAQRSGYALDGPYDIADAPSGVDRLDFGSIQVPSVEGIEIRVQDAGGGVIQQIVLTHAGSALLLVVIAAPRSEPIWPEVRSDFRESLSNDGVAVEEVDGAWGPALRAGVRTPDGMMDLRFVGIDGPRWMLRVVFQGPAAVDPESSVPLMRALRGLVINRGRDAMPAKDPLPLTFPREHLDALNAAVAAAASSDAEAPPPIVTVNGIATDRTAIDNAHTPADHTPSAHTSGGSHRAPEAQPARQDGPITEVDAPIDGPTTGNGGTVGGTSGNGGSARSTGGSVGSSGNSARGPGTVYGSSLEYGTSPFDTGSPFRAERGSGNVYGGSPNGNGTTGPHRSPAKRRPSPRPRRSE